MTAPAFTQLSLAPAQHEALEALGYTAMTPVQAQSIPLILAGRDLIVRAKTGSGKTATFGIGLLHTLNPRFFGVQALVLCPTRELADQVGTEIRRLASRMPNIKVAMLCGGKPFGPQRDSLAHGAHIIVATPGRLQDHLNKRTVTLAGVKTLVLDEADRMLSLGFTEELSALLALMPKQKQTLLFSATFPEQVKALTAELLNEPV